MRSYYNPATKLRKGEKPLTVLEKLQRIDLSGLNAAAERLGKSLSSIGESLMQIKVPEKGKEPAEGNHTFGGFKNDQEDL